MSDRGVNALDQGKGTVDEVLTPRLAARFERVLDADEQGGSRGANRGPDDRLGHGLFERALRSAPAAPVSATTTRVEPDPATVRALAAATLVRGGEILAGADAGAASDGAIGSEARTRLAQLATASPSMAALLDGAIALCTELAAGAGIDAALAWFVAEGPAIDPRLERVALGVIAAVPERRDEPRRTPGLNDALAAARASRDARRSATAGAATLRAARDAAIERAASEARAATTAAIEAALASRLSAVENARARERATVDVWFEHERARVEDVARGARAAASLAADEARRAAIEAAHGERIAELAALHETTMAAIERASATHAAALADRDGEIDHLHARWERRLDLIQRLDEHAIRAQMVDGELAEHTHALAAAQTRFAAIEEHAGRERDRAIAAAEAAEAAARARADLRYRARLRDAELAHATAERVAEAELARALDAFARTAAARRDRIERDAATAWRDAHARAAQRRAQDVAAAADAAASARAGEIDRQLAELERAARGGDS